MGNQIPAVLGRVILLVLLAGSVLMPTACGPNAAGINIVREAGLESATALEIQERANNPETDELHQGSITDPVTIRELVEVLNRSLPLVPVSECLPQYSLRFRLADERVEDFGYLCENGGSFLRGSQPFWRQEQVQPPAEFDELMGRIVSGLQ
jgi:hypothetical protein